MHVQLYVIIDIKSELFFWTTFSEKWKLEVQRNNKFIC